MLYGLETDITVDALGCIDCITGYGVACQVFYLTTMQNNVLYIDTDTHTWDMQNGGYTMELTLNISNLMDADYSMDDDSDSEDSTNSSTNKKSKKGNKKKSSSNITIDDNVVDTEVDDTVDDSSDDSDD
jgi:hypothetical protein